MTFNKVIKIDNHTVGLDHPPIVIAEISANHNGSIEIAKKTMLLAKKNGADAVKLQSYTPDTMTLNCDKDDFLIKEGNWKGYNLYQLYKEAHTPLEWHKELFDYAKYLKITCFSSVFDETSVDFLTKLDVCAFKIASFEATDFELIAYTCSKNKPVIISTGMSTLDEIKELVDVCNQSQNKNIVLLHCISSYPAPTHLYNLKTINEIKNKFNILVGLSDHTIDNIASISSIPFGSCIIEKHFTMDRSIGGPDSSFSLEPNEFKKLKQDIDSSYASLGSPNFKLKGQENINIIFRRSIYAISDIKKGEKFTIKNIKKIRPGFGMKPKYFKMILGKYANKNIQFGDPIKQEYINDF